MKKFRITGRSLFVTGSMGMKQPCCRCNGTNAKCKGCSCSRNKKGCSDCYPGRQGKCANAFVSSSRASTQPLLSNSSTSGSSVDVIQSSLPLPPSTADSGSSPHAPRADDSSQSAVPPQPPVVIPIRPPLSPPSTTRSPDTEQLESLQPTLQQLQASIETLAPALSSELPSSLPCPSASYCPQNMQQSSSGFIDPSSTLLWATNQQTCSQSPSSPSQECESLSATCCKCHSSGARCTACKCCREERSCVNCYPGRRGNCANAPAPPNVIIQSTSHLQPLHPMTHPSPTVLPPTSPPAHTVSSLPTSPQPCNPSALSQRPPVESRQNHPDPSPLSTSAPPVTPIRKQCTIEGCTALIAPSMWRIHMSLHASGALPGQVPAEWLSDQNLFVCPNCSQLVANTRQASHLQRCSQRLTNQTAHLQSPIAPEPQINLSLPTFEEVCQLHHPTLRFVPTKARPAFA